MLGVWVRSVDVLSVMLGATWYTPRPLPALDLCAVWVGGWWPSKDHCLINSITGAIIECFSPPAGNAWGGYGCLVDSQNVLWGAGGYGNYQLFRKVPGRAPTAVGGIPNFVYGLGLDQRKCGCLPALGVPTTVQV